MKPLRMPYKALLWSGLTLGMLCLTIALWRSEVHVSREGGETTIQVNGLMIEINRDIGRDSVQCIQDALRLEDEQHVRDAAMQGAIVAPACRPVRVSGIKKQASGLDRRVDARMRERELLGRGI